MNMPLRIYFPVQTGGFSLLNYNVEISYYLSFSPVQNFVGLITVVDDGYVDINIKVNVLPGVKVYIRAYVMNKNTDINLAKSLNSNLISLVIPNGVIT